MKPLIKNLTFSVVATILLFSLLETAVRVKYYIGTKDESYLFWGYTNLELNLRKHLTILSGKSSTENNDKYTIAVFGGSTVRDIHVPREFSWTKTLERLLNSKVEKKVGVLNYGQSGSNSTNDVMRMRAFLRNHSPDMIILYAGVNDHGIVRAAKLHGKYYLPEELESTFIQRLDATLSRLCLFYTALKEKYSKVILTDIHRAYKDRRRKDILQDFKFTQVEEIGLKRFRRNVIEAVKLCDQLNIKLVFGTVPMIRDKYAYSRKKDYDYYIKIMREMKTVSADFGVPLVDVAKKFDKIKEDEVRLMFLPDGTHLNKKGTAKVARIFFNHLIEQNYP